MDALNTLVSEYLRRRRGFYPMPSFSRARTLSEATVVCGGALILLLAAMTGSEWIDRHFLPDYFHPQAHRHELAVALRVLLVAGGVATIAWLRSYVGHAVETGQAATLAGRILGVLLAIALSLGVSEATLHMALFKPRHASAAEREPRQSPDERLGWTLAPNRVGTRFVGGRTVQYVIGPSGYRVGCRECAVRWDRPSILFAGESIMLGTGLQWDESIPARVGSQLHLQSIDLAVEGYASDQTYLRVATELPRFDHPVAVVSLFMPSLLPRNLKRDRPYVDASLQWHPAIKPWRLQALADRLFNYSSTADVDRGVAMTRAVLEATTRLARSRGAVALVLVPRFLPESAMEAELRKRIFEGADIDYVLVDLDRSWRVSDDRHPDARGAQVMADAVAARLRAARGGQSGSNASPYNGCHCSIAAERSSSVSSEQVKVQP